MTRYIDTYWAVIGAEPFKWCWWSNTQHNVPQDDPFGDNPRKWVNWSVRVDEVDETIGVIARWQVTHTDIMRALNRIVSDPVHYRTDVRENAQLLLSGDVDAVDFDADTADVVIQVALFNEVRYA